MIRQQKEKNPADQISSTGSPLQVAATQLHLTSGLGYGCTHHPKSPASFMGLVGKERCRVPHYQNLESGSDTQGITSKQSKCGNWIILIFGRGEKDLKYISFVYLFMPFRSFSRWAWMTDNFEERGRYVR